MSQDITQLLQAWQQGDQQAYQDLVAQTYAHLRDISRRMVQKDSLRRHIQPTELLHECAMRMADIDAMHWKDRAHFYAMATTTMRRVLVDQARRRQTEKRAGAELTLLTEHAVNQDQPLDIQTLDMALDKLTKVSESRGRIVELKFFAGLTNPEVAEVMGISEAAVKRGWIAARTWLKSELAGSKLVASSVTIDGRAIALVEEALTLPPWQRQDWLAGRCDGNQELITRTNHLLSLLTQDDARLATGGAAIAFSADASLPFQVPTQVGSYEVLTTVGQGGMGVVYKARRNDGVFDRVVAIKFVHPTMLNNITLARFAAEREILANLQHPNIAQLLDGGDVDGRPYLVMEFVEGEALRAAGNQMETVELFLQLCTAVTFAHNNGIIHRDLKPSNSLVDAARQVKLLDFGIAKLGEQLDDAITRTALSAPITPNYAAPERLRGERATVSSDVYSLGVILYELLVGERPYDLLGKSQAEALAVVKQYSTVSAASGDLDLDTILRTATHEDVARRYQTVAALAEDLNRWLQRKPILARQDELGYLFKRFVSRHRAAVVSVMVGLAAIAAALVLSVWALLQSEQQRTIAQQEAANAESSVAFLKNALQSANPVSGVNTDATVADAMAYVAENLESEFSNSPDNQVFLLNTLGEIHNARHENDTALKLADKALRVAAQHFSDSYVRKPTSLVIKSIALGNAGEFAQSVDAADQALDLLGRNTKGFVSRSAAKMAGYAWYQRGLSLKELSQTDDARTSLQQALSIRLAQDPVDLVEVASVYQALSYLHSQYNEYEAAEPLARHALTYLKQAKGLQQRSRYFNALSTYGVMMTNLRRYDEAHAAFAEALPGIRSTHGTAHNYFIFASIDYAILLEFEERYEAGIAVLEPIVSEIESRPALGITGAYFLNRLGLLLCKTSRAEEGHAMIRRGYAERVKIYSPTHLAALDSQTNIGFCLVALSRYDEAEAEYWAAHAAIIEAKDRTYADRAIYPWLADLFEASGNIESAQKYRGLANAATTKNPRN